MSDSIIRGIIRNVPINNSDEELAELLADQGVTKTQRFSSMSDNGTKVPSQTVTLFFNTPSLPREVVIAHEIFQVKQFIPRPALYRRCWNFGHPEEFCKTKQSCKYCSLHHPLDPTCLNPSKCPTCGIPGHAAGTTECPIFQNKQKIIKFVYENKLPIGEASKLLSKPQSMKPISIPNMATTAKNDIDLDNIKQEINHLRSQILLLKNHQPPEHTEARLSTLENTVEIMKKQIAPLVNLPEKVNNLQKNMDSGFEATHNQLETLMNLVKESLTLNNNDRPPPKPPHTIDRRATTTTNKKWLDR
ncbi:uncharacterized protein LOC116918687 [Daphnia magna]|uniref:uncharacterized protein LOC116918687 n=1 Tax=Daphnia magna TaxID=35525 RepID=UPI001E1B9FE5|nr:uncharacterized protein LOC116918687 [Daphnia magna]